MKAATGAAEPLDLLSTPCVGPALRWVGTRTLVRWLMLGLAIAIVLHGLLGPTLAPKNLATLLVWVHYRGLLVAGLLLLGNLLCYGCPLILLRDIARRVVRPTRDFPRRLRGKWLAACLFVLILFAYELFDLWGRPYWTAIMVVAYFAVALAIDVVFRHAAFCKFVCPIGQFSFLASTMSPFEVSVRDTATCSTCATKDCIRGRRGTGRELPVLQRGCELALFQPHKVGNLDCTMCLDCVYACPSDNIGIRGRSPGAELSSDVLHSGIGRLPRRSDLAALAVLFTFGALLNAFGMVSPVYAVESWLAAATGIRVEAPLLLVLFAAFLVVEPLLLLGGAACLTRRATGSSHAVPTIAVRYAYALVPLGFGIWLAHYGFHLLTGFWTVIPVLQQVGGQLGVPLGKPAWGAAGLSAHAAVVFEVGFLTLGTLASLVVAYRISQRDYGVRSRAAFAPWAAVIIVLFAAALWVLTQPMEMRGAFLGVGA